jgi:hypothetical protein
MLPRSHARAEFCGTPCAPGASRQITGMFLWHRSFVHIRGEEGFGAVIDREQSASCSSGATSSTSMRGASCLGA